MRGIVVAGAAAAAAGAVALAPKARGETWEQWFTKMAESWAGVPSGPLGWVNSHWVMPRLHGPIYPLMAEALELRPEDELLEVACGSGVFLANHAPDVRFAAGIDLSDLQVDLARQRLAERVAAGTAQIIKGDAAELPWEQELFSVVTCMGSMEAFPEPSLALAEMFRVLRPGGRAVLEMGWRVPEGTEAHQGFGGMWIWNDADARQLVENAGFVDVSVTYRDVRSEWAGPVGLLHRLLELEVMRIVRAAKAPSVASTADRATPTR